jgi:hypothetical protein
VETPEVLVQLDITFVQVGLDTRQWESKPTGGMIGFTTHMRTLLS